MPDNFPRILASRARHRASPDQILIHYHPGRHAAVCADFVGVNAVSRTFFASFNFTLLLWRDVVIAAVDKVVAKGDTHHRHSAA
jgi:hypothetical protein